MKVEYNKRVYGIGNNCHGCMKCALVATDKCFGNIGRCFLPINKIFVYGNYSQLFKL